MTTSDILMIIGGAIFFLSIMGMLFTAVGTDQVEYKAACVDGHGDKNLEGITCLKTRILVFGYNQEDAVMIPLIFATFGFILLGIGLILFQQEMYKSW